MTKWLCTCGFIYNEEVGLASKGIAPGTAFVAIASFACPKCGSSALEEIKITLNDAHVPVLTASYDRIKEWVMDPSGYFTIKCFPDEYVIRVRHYTNDGVLRNVIEGKKAIDVFNTLIKHKLISSLQHAADMGAELTKAEICMQVGREYIQDAVLTLSR